MATPAICRFRLDNAICYGLLDDAANTIAVLDDWDDANALSKSWADAKPGSRVIERPATLLPPIPPSEKVLCIGLNYRDHAIETGADIPSIPVVFSKFNSALIGDGMAIELPTISSEVDYEAEWVVVIGTAGRNIPVESAAEHILGYTAGHDVSARDWQKGRPGGQWLLGKSFDTFAPIGPAIIPAAHFRADDVRVRMRVSGETLQDSSISQLIFDVPTLISHLSQFMTLKPGDVILTGTPPGVGAARTPPRYLADGDVCEVEIEGIPVLTNPVISQR